MKKKERKSKKVKKSAREIAEEKAVAAMAEQIREEVDNMIIDEITVMVRGDDRIRASVKNLKKV